MPGGGGGSILSFSLEKMALAPTPQVPGCICAVQSLFLHGCRGASLLFLAALSTSGDAVSCQHLETAALGRVVGSRDKCLCHRETHLQDHLSGDLRGHLSDQ